MIPLFHLWIRSTAEGQYSVTAEYEEAQSPGADAIFTPSKAFDTNSSRLTNRVAGFRPRTLDDQYLLCQVIGEELFTAFFIGPVLNLFRAYRANNDSPRIALHIPRELYNLPWEMLRDPKDTLKTDFLALLGSIIRYDADANYDPRLQVFPTSATLTSLFLSPRPVPTPEEEGVPEIELESTARLRYTSVSPGTYGDFLRSVNRADFQPGAFIFFGHGRVEEKIGQLVFVVMQGRFVRRPIGEARAVPQVAVPLSTKKTLRLGFVMACETAWCDKGMSFDSTVAGYLLMNTSLAFVVGAQLKMNFPASEAFLGQMMTALQGGEQDDQPDPLDLALKQGRQAILALEPPACLDWWVPVMYAKSTSLALFAKPRIQIPTGSRDI